MIEEVRRVDENLKGSLKDLPSPLIQRLEADLKNHNLIAGKLGRLLDHLKAHPEAQEFFQE